MCVHLNGCCMYNCACLRSKHPRSSTRVPSRTLHHPANPLYSIIILSHPFPSPGHFSSHVLQPSHIHHSTTSPPPTPPPLPDHHPFSPFPTPRSLLISCPPTEPYPSLHHVFGMTYHLNSAPPPPSLQITRHPPSPLFVTPGLSTQN